MFQGFFPTFSWFFSSSISTAYIIHPLLVFSQKRKIYGTGRYLNFDVAISTIIYTDCVMYPSQNSLKSTSIPELGRQWKVLLKILCVMARAEGEIHAPPSDQVVPHTINPPAIQSCIMQTSTRVSSLFIYTQTCRQEWLMNWCTDKKTCSDRQTDRKMDRQIDRRTDALTGGGRTCGRTDR